MIDVFRGSAFSMVSMTDAINNLKFVPGRIGAMGLFSATSVTTRTIWIEQKGGILTLIPPSAIGSDGETLDKAKANARDFRIPHFQVNDNIDAEEVQGIRAFGSETAVETVANMVTRRMGEISQSFDATEEYDRIGAVKGVISRADGSTTNLFDEFSVSQEPTVFFDLDNSSPAGGALRKKCAGVIRQMAGILEGNTYRGIHAFCGDDFFDSLISHKEVRETYLQQQEASSLREGYIDGGAGGSYGSFNFGGITWENYRGAVDGTNFVESGDCHLFPTGVPNLFRTYYAPADYNQTVNTMGSRLYAKLKEKENDKGFRIEIQMNALSICTRPRVLLQGSAAAS